MLETLNQSSHFMYHYSPKLGCEKIDIYTRFSDTFIRPIRETPRLTIRHLTLPGVRDILLAVAHLPSKLRWNEASQVSESIEIAHEIRDAEQQVGHRRTILVGDLNMNPFEGGMIVENGFHAVMTRHLAKREERTVQSKSYPFFYNPMWRFFGDATNGPSGTYYYDNSEHKVYFWNMFDQVLIRPTLLDCFSTDELEILQTDGILSFMSSQNTPDSRVASDHLPIRFVLNI
jgi:hypothetical protein